MDQALTYTRTMVAQLSPPELHEFGLPSALKWLTEQMKEHGLTVELDLKRDMAPLPEDQAVLLFQSVRELLLNVVKHGRTNHAKVSVIEAEGMLRVAVMDQGAGFDLTAARASSTSGFGLFSIRERMVSLGGRYELLSRPDEGTQATLILPRAPRTATAADVELGTRSEDSTCQSSFEPKAKVRVLLVDDHAMVRQGLRGLLDAYADVEIVGEAANGEQAVALTDQLQPSVILMDVNMPKMDGIRATKRIKQEMPAAIVIGLSVQNGEDVEAAMREAGASAFLNKEAAVEQLYQTIQAMRSAALT
jgi:CheY-like chemotaxis protein